MNSYWTEVVGAASLTTAMHAPARPDGKAANYHETYSKLTFNRKICSHLILANCFELTSIYKNSDLN